MNAPSRLLFALLLSLCTLGSVSLAPAEEQVDYGDEKSETLLAKAWEAFSENRDEAALAYCARCIKLYSEAAEQQQEQLTDFAPESLASEQWALNDVGTAYFITGQIHDRHSERKKAKAAYEAIVNRFGFSQCWDPQGWYWHPADVAQTRLDEMGSDSDSDSDSE